MSARREDEISRVMQRHGVGYAEAASMLSARPAAELLQAPPQPRREDGFRSSEEAATDAVMRANPGRMTRTDAMIAASVMTEEEIERITAPEPVPMPKRAKVATMRSTSPPAAVPALRLAMPHAKFADRPAVHAASVATTMTGRPRSILDTPVPFERTREGRAQADGQALIRIKAVGGHS